MTLRPAWLAAVVRRPGWPVADLLLWASLMLAVAGFLGVRRATNAGLMVLFLLALGSLPGQWRSLRAQWTAPWVAAVSAGLASAVAVALFAMLLRGGVEAPTLDGPARFLMAALVLPFLAARQVEVTRVLAVALPLANVLALASALTHPEAAVAWSGRLATPFVDPNSLGGCTAILTMSSLLLWTRDAPLPGRALLLAGIVCGLATTLLASSRGGWLALPPLALLLVLFRLERGPAVVAGLAAAGVALTLAAFLAFPEVGARALRSVAEVRAWLDGSNPETPAGQRLSLWRLALAALAQRPLAGYGGGELATLAAQAGFGQGASEQVRQLFWGAGPHNDLLALCLAHGAGGAVAYAGLVLLPLVAFWRRRHHPVAEARLAAECGVFLVLGTAVCGLTNEMLSLKYLASFHGLTVAALAAQLAWAEAGAPLEPSEP